MAGRGSRRTARTEVGALKRAGADAGERRAVTLRKLWCAVVGTRSAGGVNPTMGSMNYRDRYGGSCSGGEFMRTMKNASRLSVKNASDRCRSPWPKLCFRW